MEKDKRIIAAEINIKSAKENEKKAREMLESGYKKLCEAYEEVFEEIVCKKGERLVCKKRNIDGFYKGFRYSYGNIVLIWCPAKKDGTMSKVEYYEYYADIVIEEFLEKQK